MVIDLVEVCSENDENEHKLIAYWQNKLQNYEILNLPTDFNRPPQFEQQFIEQFNFEINQETTGRLKEFSQHLNVDLNR